jgi:hypothetical protein
MEVQQQGIPQRLGSSAALRTSSLKNRKQEKQEIRTQKKYRRWCWQMPERQNPSFRV